MQRAWKLRLVAAAIILPTAFSILLLGHGRGSSASVRLPDLVELRPSTFAYRANGEFTRDGRPAVAPMVTIAMPPDLAIMRHQVTAADYRLCVDAGACPKTDTDTASDRPVVLVSWVDAQAYASWLSRETGQHFRLPTDEEWVYAAASRFADDAVEQGDPGRRELATYTFEANQDAAIDRMPKPIGSFGANENGLLDVAGNVWEWTDTCFVRRAVDEAGNTIAKTPYCGVRIAEGRHRAYVIDFVHDAKRGGCAVGTPPTNLGLRLVRDDEGWSNRHAWLAKARRYFGLDA